MPNEKKPTLRKPQDRRHDEIGPPSGWKERRRSVERRKPEVLEATLDDWNAALSRSGTGGSRKG